MIKKIEISIIRDLNWNDGMLVEQGKEIEDAIKEFLDENTQYTREDIEVITESFEIKDCYLKCVILDSIDANMVYRVFYL